MDLLIAVECLTIRTKNKAGSGKFLRIVTSCRNRSSHQVTLESGRNLSQSGLYGPVTGGFGDSQQKTVSGTKAGKTFGKHYHSMGG